MDVRCTPPTLSPRSSSAHCAAISDTVIISSIAGLFGVPRVNMLALATGLFAAILVFWIELKKRAQNRAYGMAVEPAAFFWARISIIAFALVFIPFKRSTFRGLPNVLISMGVLTVLYAFFTERTVTGRRIYATGGNIKAARLSGVRTERLTFLAFVNTGVLAAIAGMVFAARLNSATPKAGFALELDVIAAVFIGAAYRADGQG